MKQPYIFNIQKFSVHDGPGIRTTVFFKGCPMRCLWCHNPESQAPEHELFIEKDGHTERIGRQYSVQELTELLGKDQLFYDQSGGGVTLSGGEVMAMDMDYITELLGELQRMGISVAIDTCGYTSLQNFRRIYPLTDLFLYDLKLYNNEEHLRYTGVENKRILENLRALSAWGADIILCLILVRDVNVDEASIDGLKEWLMKHKIAIRQIDLLPYHDFGRDKYARLKRTCTQNFSAPEDSDIERIKTVFREAGYCVTVQ